LSRHRIVMEIEESEAVSWQADLYRAALAGPLRAVTRKDAERMLAECVARLAGSRLPNAVNVSYEL
jgi:hypothetical protein